VITLGEGGTPLLAAPRLSAQLGVEVWLKWEGANPTGSFKDRGMAVAVGRALEAGAQGVVCASTGNTAASAAAYAARAGIGAAIVVPAGAVAAGKLAQVAAAGALPRIYPAQAGRRGDTAASAIRIVQPVHRAEVEEAVQRSGGTVVTLSEDEIASAWRDVGRLEGIFCEPASAAAVGALGHGVAQAGERAVCVLTGHGLKDPDAIARLAA